MPIFSFQMAVEMFDYLDDILALEATSKATFAHITRLKNLFNFVMYF